ncbi:MAG: hypothetical protein A2Y54_04770 [Chloroflexi bacterium RBG_16_51_16]|nr:MAG: hypothetical protein A2Y54_04770 [Chloroflexi bacterium RBG_16_51_16]
MVTPKTESLPPPPGIIHSIRAGFDVISTNLAAILLPLMLDVFLWLGPRLSLERLFLSLQSEMMAIWKAGGISAADLEQLMEGYKNMVPQFNLFWLLRTIPVGISSLMFARNLPQTPLGLPTIWQVTGGDLILWMGLLIFLGWVGGGLYFRWVARFSIPDLQEQLPGTLKAVAQTVLLSIVWTGLTLAIGLPVFLFVALLFQVNSILAQIVILGASFLSMWLIVPMFFWPHGIFIKNQNFLVAIISSAQMARFTLPTSSMFVLTIFLLGFGLNFVWSIPSPESWMTVVGILGHAFITTALLAASFIYYRDMTAWLQTVMERLKASRTVTRQV